MKTIPHPILGGLTATRFLRDYWQKKPLLIRQAFANFSGLLNPQQLFAMACSEDAQARVVTQLRGQWQVQSGPFKTAQFDKLSKNKNKWTVLVQGVNHILPAGAELLHNFNFIPHARLDDLMVSYASKGGGVGPHFDSYDVFLLQGSGHRRWQISAQQDRTLVNNAPLKILRNFQPEQEWVLAPGDMLYLPPQYAHNGVAEEDCMTYSIGFRSPTYQELAEQFLVYLQDHIRLNGMYADPGLKLQKHAADISSDMLNQVATAIQQVQWDKGDIANFIGCYLSEPKPHIFFEPPARPMSCARFLQAVQIHGIKLDLKSLMLCHKNTIFLNGIAFAASKEVYCKLRILANARQLDADAKLPPEALDLLYQWYSDGYIALNKKPPRSVA